MYGMTEEQFWDSNPKIIDVWEEAYRMKMNRQNELIYQWFGNYGISAFSVAIDHCFNGRKAKYKYMTEPIELFEKTEKEKKNDIERQRQAFIDWAKRQKNKKGG